MVPSKVNSNSLRPAFLPSVAVLLVGFAVPGLAAPLRHFVYGLDGRYRYCVAVGEERILADAAPGPAGDLLFDSEGGATVHVTVSRDGTDPSGSLPPGPDLRLRGPFPNPVRDRAEFLVTTGTEGPARFRLYDPMAGQISVDLVTPLHVGENSVRIELRSRVSSGVYLLRADLPGGTATRKIVFIRR